MQEYKAKLGLEDFQRMPTGELMVEEAASSCSQVLEELEALHLYIIPMGIDPADPKNSTKRKGPYILPALATNYLLRKFGALNAPDAAKGDLEQAVFDRLTEEGFFVAEEQNFGARFAVYEGSPNILNNHAKFLVFTHEDPKMYLVSRISTLLKKQVGVSYSRPCGRLGARTPKAKEPWSSLWSTASPQTGKRNPTTDTESNDNIFKFLNINRQTKTTDSLINWLQKLN